jgi:DNA-binding CsgD family transcriptional regulator
MVAAACAGHCDDADLATVVKYLAWLGAYAEADRVLAHWCAAGRACTDELRKTTHWLRYAHFRLARRVSAVQSDERPTGAPRLLGIQAVRGVLAGGPAQPWITDAEQILRQTRLVHRSLAGTVEPSQAAILALLHAGRLDLAAIKSDELLARIADLGADTWLAAANSLRAEIAVRRGEPRMAIDHARRALDLMDADSWGVLIGIPLGCLVTGLSLTGRHDEAATALAETVPEVMFESRAGLCYLQGRATAAATQHRWPDALRDNERCGWIMREHGVDLPVLVDWRTGAARAHLELDRPDLAASLVREVLDLPGGDRPGVRGPALRVLAATVPHPQERVVLLTAAAQLLDGEGGNRVELCGALRELSRAHQAVGETTKARACADKAALHHAGPHREMAGLSDAERRVAALTADGRSNREVADTLLITVSTVEQHLTRIYRKLDIACRQELVTLLRPDSLD